MLKVSRSSYYAYLTPSSSTVHRRAKQAELAQDVKSIFEGNYRRYGSRRIHEEMLGRGKVIGRDRVRMLMRNQGLRAIQPRSFVPKTTRAAPHLARSPNLLRERVLAKEPLYEGIREVLVGDITYWPRSTTGWFYLAIWMDLCSRRILGWSVDTHMRAELVCNAFEKASVWLRGAKNCIIHSDGGGQYKSHEFRAMIYKHASLNWKQSMTRKDNHYDNAFIESLFSRIKAELMDLYPVFRTKEEAQMRLFEYIEGYYNPKRRHSSLGYLSPIDYEKSLETSA